MVVDARSALLRRLLAECAGFVPREHSDLRGRIAEALREPIPTARRQPLPSDYEDPYFAVKEIDRCE